MHNDNKTVVEIMAEQCLRIRESGTPLILIDTYDIELVNEVAWKSGIITPVEKAIRFTQQRKADYYYFLAVASEIWKETGWSAIIYIAALANVDIQQHEAAILDGATRWQRVIHVDLPAIMPMVSVMLIMSIGGLMGVGYEKALLMHTDGNLAVSELIATYVYKKGLTGVPDQAYATAIGLFNSVINVILLIIANTTSKKFSENSLW